MKIKQLGVVAALVLGLVAWTNVANAQEKDKGGKRGMPSVQERLDKMTEELKLTDEQKPKVKVVLEESDKKRQELFADTSVPRDQRREKMQAITEQQDKKLKEILKPDQYEKYEKMPRPGRGAGKRGEEKKSDTKKN